MIGFTLPLFHIPVDKDEDGEDGDENVEDDEECVDDEDHDVDDDDDVVCTVHILGKCNLSLGRPSVTLQLRQINMIIMIMTMIHDDYDHDRDDKDDYDDDDDHHHHYHDHDGSDQHDDLVHGLDQGNADDDHDFEEFFADYEDDDKSMTNVVVKMIMILITKMMMKAKIILQRQSKLKAGCILITCSALISAFVPIG